MTWLSLYDIIYNSTDFTPQERYYMFSQIISELFTTKHENMYETDLILFTLYKKIINEFSVAVNDSSEFIFNRNTNLVVITTNQFLQPLHAPTAAVLNLADYLFNHGKQVLIVNTAEFMGGLTSELPYKSISADIFSSVPHRRASYISDYNSLNTYEHNGKSYSFFQFDNNMPNIEDIRLFIDTIKKLKPMYLINVGGMSPLSDLCSKLVPTLCLGMSNSVSYSYAHAQYFGKKCDEFDEQLLKILDKDAQTALSGRFIYNINSNYDEIERSDLNIPDNVKVLAVVGNRLSDEIDDAFLYTMDKIISANIHIAFIGTCTELISRISKYNNISDYSHFLGYRNDLMSVLAVCDLFVNPIRKGGGTSAVIALKAGIPVVTTPVGDIATAVGKEFIVDSLSDYPYIIEKYLNDSFFFKSQSEKAKMKSEVLTDSKSMYDSLFEQFSNLIHTIS